MSISKKTKDLNVSGIRKVFDLASRLKDPINLSIGQPDFDVFDSVKETAIDCIKKGLNKYTPSAGIPSLRNKIKTHLSSRGLEVSDTIITSGVSGGLTLAILALMDPGDEILVPDPYFVMYPELVKLYGGTPVYIDTYPDFLLTAEKIKKAITPKTKILFLNSPSNPTGRIIPREDLKQIADVLKNTGIWVISDDIYDLFDYENKHSLFGNLYEKTITLGGFSKTAAMTGWRVGFAGGPAEVIDAMIKLQQYTFVCSPSFAQYAAVTAMDVEKEYIKDDYRKKRDLVFNMMKNNFEIVKPDGAFYAFIKHPSINGDDFVQKALDKNVMLIPGSVFSSRNTHFRLSFANTLEKLQTGIQTLLQIK